MTRATRVLRTLWLTTAILVVVFALLLTITRLVLPLAENFRDDLAAWASEALGRPVEVERISARWYRWGPELALFDVRMSDSEEGPVSLRFDEVHIGIDLLSALGERQLQPSTIRVIGTRVAIERLADGRIQLQGLGIGATGGGGNRAAGLAWLFSRQHLLLEGADLTVIDRRRDPATLQLSNINLELRNDGNRHRLLGRLELPESYGRTLTVALDAHDLVAAPDAWRARLHLRVAGVRLATLAAQFPRHAPPVAEGSADLELWGDMQRGRIEALSGRLGVTGLAVRGANEQIERFDALGGDFVWNRKPDGWRVQGSGVRVVHAGGGWPSGGFQVDYRKTGDAPERGVIGARWDYLRIEDLSPLLVSLPLLPDRWREIATQIAPTGSIVGGEVEARLGTPPRFRLQAELKDIGFQPWNKVPGIQGLSGRVMADERSGRAQIESNDMRLDAPLYFRGPFGAQFVTAALEWSRVGAGWGVAVRRAAVSDPVAKARGVLDIEWQPDEGAFLDLRARFTDADGSDISPYLPVGKMPETTVAWLDRAIVAGRSPRGELIYRGRIKRFPFLEHEGRFHVRFDAEQAELDYQPGWPRIANIDAAVEFEEATMRVHARRGAIFDAQLEDVEATIPNLKRNPVLSVSGSFALPVASGVRFLRESPLTEGYRERLVGLKASGAASLRLDLTVPLRKGTHPDVAGLLELQGARLASDTLPVALENLRGRLRFSEALLEGTGLRGTLFGADTRFDIAAPLGRYRSGKPPGTIKARGSAAGESLAALLQQPALGKRLTGLTRWEATWRLPRQEGDASHLEVRSDLQGLAIDLPSPVGKPADQASELTVDVELARDAQRDIALRYADRVDARLRLRPDGEEMRLERGEVRFGGARARLPGETGLTVAGDLQRLAIAEWRISLGGWGRAWDLSGGALRRIVLRIDNLLVARQRVRDVRLALAKGQGSWEGSVNGEGAKGYLRVPFTSGEAPVLLRFDHLRVERDPEAREAEEGKVWPDPQRTPPIEITVSELRLNGEPLGKLALRTARVKGGMRIARFLVQGENLQFDASGDWMGDARSTRSAIDMRLESANLGRLLRALDYAEGVKNGRTRAEAHLTWPGPPGDPDLEGMTGRVALAIDSGRLVDIEPGAGRIFGLLSFQALPRRLMFDFRDFFLKGFSFDEIKGDFRIHRGDAYSDNLSVQGPAARIEIIGRTGLALRDYDQLVTVIPNVTGGLPLAGWAAGGPAVGAVMLFFQKMFGKKIDESSGFRYRVTGSWDNPELEKLTPPGADNRGEP